MLQFFKIKIKTFLVYVLLLYLKCINQNPNLISMSDVPYCK